MTGSVVVASVRLSPPQCLLIVLDEDREHRLHAERDLVVLEARAS